MRPPSASRAHEHMRGPTSLLEPLGSRESLAQWMVHPPQVPDGRASLVLPLGLRLHRALHLLPHRAHDRTPLGRHPPRRWRGPPLLSPSGGLPTLGRAAHQAGGILTRALSGPQQVATPTTRRSHFRNHVAGGTPGHPHPTPLPRRSFPFFAPPATLATLPLTLRLLPSGRLRESMLVQDEEACRCLGLRGLFACAFPATSQDWHPEPQHRTPSRQVGPRPQGPFSPSSRSSSTSRSSASPRIDWRSLLLEPRYSWSGA